MSVITNPPITVAEAAMGKENSFVMITHNGAFHNHEIFGAALLQRFYGEQGTIIRTRNPQVLELGGKMSERPCPLCQGQESYCQMCGTTDSVEMPIYLFDVGRKVDAFSLDHHQDGWKKKWISKGKPLSDMFFGFTIKDLSNERLELLAAVADQDNGIQNELDIPQLGVFNSNWNEPQTDEYTSGRFDLAVETAHRVLFYDEWNHSNLEEAEFIRNEADALAHDEMKHEIERYSGSRTIVLERFIPWEEAIFEANDAGESFDFVVFPALGKKGSWMVKCVPPGEGSFEQRVPLDDKIVAGENGCEFVHDGKFIAQFASLVDAENAVNSL